jgi:glycosyltransferase involved in cell wall biosynthesis
VNNGRVLLLASEIYTHGGIQRFNRTLLSASERLGLTVDAMSLGDSEPRSDPDAPLGTVSVYGHHRVRFAAAVTAAISRSEYHAVIVGHVNLVAIVAAVLKIRRPADSAVYLIAHGIEVWSGLRGSRRWAVRAMDQILCVSEYTRRRISEQIPDLESERFVLFPNALSATLDPPAISSAAPIDAPERFILSVSRLDPRERYKGIVTAIEAFAMVDDTSLQYLIAGRGEDEPFLRQVAFRCGVAERVHFLGAVGDQQLVQLYRSCTAFVLPSGKEGFGIVYLEAMRSGAVVIAARAGGVIDVVRDGETGLLVEFGGVVQLAEAINKVLGDRELSARLRRQALAEVTGDGPFTFEMFVRRLERLLVTGRQQSSRTETSALLGTQSDGRSLSGNTTQPRAGDGARRLLAESDGRQSETRAPGSVSQNPP